MTDRAPTAAPTPGPSGAHRVGSDVPFFTFFLALSSFYILFILALIVADVVKVTRADFVYAFNDPKILYAIKLSMLTCTITAILSVWVAVPIGYLMSRFRIPGKNLIDACLDIPIVLPPLVIGLSLLILFGLPVGGTAEAPVSLDDKIREISNWALGRNRGVVFEIPAIILAQFMVACAFAVRTMRVTFDHIHPRNEDVAMTLGCSRSQAFWMVVLPQAWRGVITAGTLAWARALGEFGPILVFAGSVRTKTEVLPTTVFLELTIGNIGAALAVSLMMIAAAVVVLLVVRVASGRSLIGGVG